MSALALPPAFADPGVDAASRDIATGRKWLARADPAHFASYATGGRYQQPPHIRLLADKLVDVALGRTTRLCISLPPRHGKSMLTSHYFPAWLLGNYPDKSVILTSYAASLAEGFSLRAMQTFMATAPALFGVSISSSMATRAEWRVQGHDGFLVAAGVGGGITGKGGHVLIVDDPFANASDANSVTVRESTDEWYKAVAYTRLEPGGAVIIVATRWNEDDLTGRRLAADEGFEFVNLPALAEEQDPLGRKPGKALWPARYDEAALKDIAKTVGAYWFASLYQGRPAPIGGALFKKEHFSYYTELETSYALVPRNSNAVRRIPKRICRVVQFVDLAASLRTSADYFVIATIAFGPQSEMIVLDIFRARLEGSTQRRTLLELYHRWRPEVVAIEKAGYQLTMIQDAIRMGLPALELHPDTDKFSRAVSAAARYEAREVFHPNAAEWLVAFEDELLRFPNAQGHDDQVDVIAYAARWFAEGASSPAMAGSQSQSTRYDV